MNLLYNCLLDSKRTSSYLHNIYDSTKNINYFINTRLLQNAKIKVGYYGDFYACINARLFKTKEFKKMLKNEKNFDFQKRICNIHRPIPSALWTKPEADEYSFGSSVKISLLCEDTVARVAVEDLVACFKKCFGITATVCSCKTGADITLSVDKKSLGENANGYMGRRIEVTEKGVTVEAYDERGIAQAIYYLEDRMKKRCAPILKFGVTEARPAFSPRMVHSGYDMDVFPDEYLSAIAHEGYDAIIVFVKDAKHSAHGECDFVDIVKRAKKYGIDVYAYSYLVNFMHPEEPGAKEHYAELYGGIFRDIPGLHGMIFVGESIEFASNDPHVAKKRVHDKPKDGIPDGKISPGWWPCEDYPEWISLVRDSIRAQNPDADVVFWTYNFGYVEEKYRAELIRKLPTDISLLVTYEMFDLYSMGNGEGMVMDYTISHVGPGKYFVSEAKIAAERGIRLYSQVNTGGRTWDYGIVPYEPFPYQWNARHKSLLESREKYGLCGLMESHHFGFLPSFVSEICNNNYTLGGMSFEDKLTEIAREYAGDQYEKFIEGIKAVDESIRHYIPSDECQYGAYRVGPAYPLCLVRGIKYPNPPGVYMGNRIYGTMRDNYDHWGRHDCYSLRVRAEIEEEKIGRECVKRGLAIFKTIENPSEKMERLINLTAFIEKCITTAINAQEFYVESYKMYCADTKAKLKSSLTKLERIAKAEYKNAKSAIPLVRRDSSIGFEASMGYQCDETAICWKLRQLDYLLNSEIMLYKRSVDPKFGEGKYIKF